MLLKKQVVREPRLTVCSINFSFFFVLYRRVCGNRLEGCISNQVIELSTGAAVAAAPLVFSLKNRGGGAQRIQSLMTEPHKTFIDPNKYEDE